MKIPQARCDDAQLIALINDGLSGERLESMLLHIEECDRCRMRMEELSADSHQWQKTVKVLSDIQSDVRHSQPSSIARFLLKSFRYYHLKNHSIQMILSFLSSSYWHRLRTQRCWVALDVMR